MNEPILSTSGVTKSFGGLTAVKDVSLELPAGQIMGLMGPNGAGKTTLVNVICGLYKPDSGKIRFQGRDISGLSPHRICRLGIARTYQIPQPFGELTALHNVAVAAMFGKGMSRGEAESKAPKVLHYTELADKQDVLAKDMSTLTLKRLEVARALATEPSLLLVDEAAAGLDESELPRMLDLLESIRETGITIMLIEHVMKVMREAVDKILVIDEGAQLAYGTPAEVMADEKVVECYLGEYAS